MFGSTVLEVAIGLFFVYVLLSLLCSSINELLAGLFKWRAKDLDRGIANLLCDPRLIDAVLKHPLINGLGNTKAETLLVRKAAGEDRQGKQGYAGKPSYIPARTFSLALFDALAPAVTGPVTVERLRFAALRRAQSQNSSHQAVGRALLTLIDESQDPRTSGLRVVDVKQMVQQLAPSFAIDPATLQAMIDPARTMDELRQALSLLPDSSGRTTVLRWLNAGQSDLNAVRASVEAWFNNAMERVSDVYQRRIRVYLFFIALVVTFAIGADTLKIVKTLATNTALRGFVVAEADRVVTPNGTLVLPANSNATQALTTTITVITGPNKTITTTTTTDAHAHALSAELNKLGLLFGYQDGPNLHVSWWRNLAFARWWSWVGWKLVGLTMTAFALSLGAPFWFDVLQRVANVRTSNKPSAASDAAHAPGDS